jgi:predicted CxxxxCH...CXXCH cytochrome family protein
MKTRIDTPFRYGPSILAVSLGVDGALLRRGRAEVSMRRLLALSAVVALAACDLTSRLSPSENDCVGCHGGTDNNSGAPPRDTAGNTSTTAVGVGAHTRHGSAGIGCEQCHPVPARVHDPATPVHLDGKVDVVFAAGSLAHTGTANPLWTAAGATCSSVYCHGATLPDGGAAPAPVWNGGALAGAPCGSCHSFPNHGAAPDSCEACHASSVISTAGVGTTLRAGGTHLNGVIDSDVSSSGLCTRCHGDRTRGQGLTDAAPPAALTGYPAAGAHQRHLQPGPFAGPLACAECHVVPTNLAHAASATPPAAVTFNGTLGTQSGVLSPSYDSTARTCSNTYCHGDGVAGQTTSSSPGWVTGTVTCGGCHPTPPTFAKHPQTLVDGTTPITSVTQCWNCHPGTVTSAGTIDVGNGLHVNGAIDLAVHPVGFATVGSTAFHGPAAKRNLARCKQCHGAALDGSVPAGVAPSCNACHATSGAANWKTNCLFCHGLGTRTTDAAFPEVGSPVDPTNTQLDGTKPVVANLVAPPAGSQGEQSATQVAVGAHLAHIQGGAFAREFLCSECHGALPTNIDHVTGAASVDWGALAQTSNTSPTPATGAVTADWEASPTCTNYCHGATRVGGTHTTPSWTGGAAEATCGTCHSAPPPYSAAGGWHVQNTGCGRCHDGYSLTVPFTDAAKATHIDGTVETPTLDCTTCHSQADATWMDTNGSTTGNRAGAHGAHVAGARFRQTALACTECHPDQSGLMRHANGQVDVSWGALAQMVATTPTPAGPITTGSAVSCTNYCHGAALPGAAARGVTYWIGTIATTTCTACHGAPPTGTKHVDGFHETFPCASCHASVMTADPANKTFLDKSLHMNGTREFLLGAGVTGSYVLTGSTYSCNVSCHNSGAGGTHASAGW